ncbi:uncharacterized protein [Physcomitrium patens]|uniref:DUF7796 domain-containing protein n=1 Tax=Physcomitrium patens TaxID=3218 RepID=A0A2K1J2U1_PHYPA|nr:uncharacterized protein LOC112294000 [Physcomitrium patens]PNR35845.1 hypothetical protein PHYPA_021695 [Physcomitrium patens]|eukprot:XP_024399824.1 uncharacterized protein LOC112294000 [Physcomitrella patens]
MMTVVVSKLSWIVSVVFLISVVALVGYQFPAKTPLAHYQLWYPLSTAKENAAPGPNTSNRSELYVGEAGLAAASPVPLEGRFEESTRSRVAVCLVGGARAFELTGKTLMKYVLNAYNDTDVFLHSPLDKDSHKFSLLSGASGLASARVFIPKQLPESRLQREVLTAANSPNGIQGLLQYFHLVEGCLEMITEHESKHNIKYDWIVRTRVDGYWRGPLPPLSSFNSSVYYIPHGSHYGGLNDRLGIGNSENSRVALSRLSLLPLLHKRGARNLNSETAFKAQLKFTNLWYSSTNFPFCILTYRKYSWPPAYFGVPVASLSTKGDLNGAKCRPCTPKSSGSEAQRLVSKLSKGWGWPGLIDGLELCDAHQDWEPQWRTVYEKESGEQLSGDAQRVTTRSVSECVRDMEEFQKQWEVWDAPPPLKICSEGREDEVYSDSDESVN